MSKVLLPPVRIIALYQPRKEEATRQRQNKEYEYAEAKKGNRVKAEVNSVMFKILTWPKYDCLFIQQDRCIVTVTFT